MIQAAGAVLWRPGQHRGIEIALIHRPRYDDWSLPKGKVDPGEPTIIAAVREVREETGLHCTLGRRLPTIEYTTRGEAKHVHYWAAQADPDHSRDVFVPNDEVDELRWLPVETAAATLSYPDDRAVVAEFRQLPVPTHTTVIVRHAKAGSRAAYSGSDDRQRPLDKHGTTQARALVPLLSAFGASTVHSADPERCVATVRPLAEALGTDVILEPDLSESAYATDPEAAPDRVRKIAALGTGRVICSQGKVIPGLLHSLADPDGLELGHIPNRKGSFWVLSWHEGTLIAADYVDAP